MRRKKLANKIVSILMAGLMLVSTPMSVLATDGEIQQMEDQIEVQTSMDNEEIKENDDSLTEEMIGEDAEDDVIADEEVTVDEPEVFDGEAEEEIILGDSEQDEAEAVIQSAEEKQSDAVAVQNGEEIKKQAEMAVEDFSLGQAATSKYDWLINFNTEKKEYNIGVDDTLVKVNGFLKFSKDIPAEANLDYTFYVDGKILTGQKSDGKVKSGATVIVFGFTNVIRNLQKLNASKDVVLKIGEKDADGNYTENAVSYTFHVYRKAALKSLNVLTEDGTSCALEPQFAILKRKEQYNVCLLYTSRCV